MLPVRTEGTGGPWVILLHWLGGSARSWSQVSRTLAREGYRVGCIDLPGFGDAASLDGCGVAAMAAAVIDTIRSLLVAPNTSGTKQPWLLGGHSMGGKVAAVVARHAEDGEAGLESLAGLVMVSASPPGPEPMPGGKREQLLKQFGLLPAAEVELNATQLRSVARTFLADNTGRLALPEDVRLQAEDELLRLNRQAFQHWLTDGSREDWSDRVSTLSAPALVLAGSEDGALGTEAQQTFLLPHLHSSELVTLEGAGHLAPLERPTETANRILAFARRIGVEAKPPNQELNDRFRSVLEGALTSPQTRKLMESRLNTTLDGEPQSTDREGFLLLRALVGCVIPGAPCALAARLDHRLAFGAGDGWRYASLPADRAAWSKGLLSLNAAAHREHQVPFTALWPDQQHRLLEQARSGDLGNGLAGLLKLGAGADAYTAGEMKLWFEEVRGELTRLYMSDPSVMQRVGFEGFADEAGFTQIRLGETEEFER